VNLLETGHLENAKGKRGKEGFIEITSHGNSQAQLITEQFYFFLTAKTNPIGKCEATTCNNIPETMVK